MSPAGNGIASLRAWESVDLRCPCQLPLHLGCFLFVFCSGLKLTHFQSRQRSNNNRKKKKKELFPGLWACGHLNLSFTVLPEWGSPYPAMPSALALPLVSGALHLPDLGSEVKVSAQLTSPCSWALEELGWLVSGQWDSVPYLLGWELVLSDVARS